MTKTTKLWAVYRCLTGHSSEMLTVCADRKTGIKFANIHHTRSNGSGKPVEWARLSAGVSKGVIFQKGIYFVEPLKVVTKKDLP